jgi:glycerophosphoryl diester phosphodiesterase
MDRALIERLHARGWRALVYTVNDADVAQRLIADGIDGLITDRVDTLGPA